MSFLLSSCAHTSDSLYPAYHSQTYLFRIWSYFIRIKIYIMTFGTDIMRGRGFTSVIPDIVAAKEDPTEPREPTR